MDSTYVRPSSRLPESTDGKGGLRMEKSPSWPSTPDRYNRPGEWKLLADPRGIPGVLSAIPREPDDTVLAVLYYIEVTKCPGIEFVVRTPVEFPEEYVRFGDPPIWLYKCSYPATLSEPSPDHSFYDGWLPLEMTTPQQIRLMLNHIDSVLQLVAFVFNSYFRWKLKYRPTMPLDGHPSPRVNYPPLLQEVLGSMRPSQDDPLATALSKAP